MSSRPVDLRLRPLSAADLPWFVRVRNEVRDSLHDPRAFTLEEAAGWFGRGRTRYWVVERRAEPVGYFRFAADPELNGGAWIGADVAPEHHRQGIAKSAYPAFMRWMENALGVSSWWLEVLETNVPARGLYESLGFRETRRYSLPTRGCASLIMTAGPLGRSS